MSHSVRPSGVVGRRARVHFARVSSLQAWPHANTANPTLLLPRALCKRATTPPPSTCCALVAHPYHTTATLCSPCPPIAYSHFTPTKPKLTLLSGMNVVSQPCAWPPFHPSQAHQTRSFFPTRNIQQRIPSSINPANSSLAPWVPSYIPRPSPCQVGWTPNKIPDLSGKVALVTGGNSGIGLEVVRKLAQNCAHVLMVSRDKCVRGGAQGAGGRGRDGRWQRRGRNTHRFAQQHTPFCTAGFHTIWVPASQHRWCSQRVCRASLSIHAIPASARRLLVHTSAFAPHPLVLFAGPGPWPWPLARRERGEAAAEEVRSSLGMSSASSLAPGSQARGRIEVLQCDLADLKAVEGLVKEVKRRTKTTGLSMLLCNAGGYVGSPRMDTHVPWLLVATGIAAENAFR